MPTFGQGYNVLVDGQLHNEIGTRAGHDTKISGQLMERLCRKITDHADELVDVDSTAIEDAEIMVIAYGSVSRSADSAVKAARSDGIKAGLLKLKILWPFPDKIIRSTIQGANKIIVPEMNIGKISREVERLTVGAQQVVALTKLGGEMHTPDEIMDAIRSA